MKVTACSDRPILTECSLKDINYQIDPYVGCQHYCYYCYALEECETDWTKEIRIHREIIPRLDKELDKIAPQKIYLGYKTDPYQPVEKDWQQTGKVLELFLEKGFSASILTKSDLVVRDLDILKDMSEASVSVSVAFNDNDVRCQFEDNTIDTEKRIDALRELRSAGIKTNALICPVIPYLTDVEPLIDLLESCTDKIWIYGISMQDRSNRSWMNVQNILNNHYSNLKDEIETLIFDRDHPFWLTLRNKLLKLEKQRNLNLSIHV